MRFIRINRKIAVIGFAVLMLLIAIPLAVLHLPLVQNRIFQFLASGALRSGNLEIRADSFRYNLILGTAKVRGLKLRAASASEMAPLAEIPSAAIRFRTLRLMQGLAAITGLHLDRPSVYVALGSDGKTNLPTGRSEAPYDLSYLPDEISIEGGSLHMEDSARGFDLLIPGLRLRISRGKSGRDVSLSAPEAGMLQIKAESLPISEFRLSGQLIASDLDIREFSARVGGNRIMGKGRIRNLSDPDMKLMLTSQLDLAELSRLISQENSISGSLAVSATITGTARNLTAGMSAEFASLRFPVLDPFSGTAALEYKRSSNTLLLKSLNASSALGEFSAAGSLSYKDEESRGELRADLHDVGLGSVMAALKLNPNLTTHFSGPVSVSWKNMDWRTATGQAQLAFQSADMAERNRAIPLDGSLALAFNETSLHVRIPSLAAPGFRIAADLQTSRSLKNLSGEMSGEIHDVEALLSAARNAWGQQIPSIQIPIAGLIRFNARLDGSLGSPHILADVGTDALSAGPFAGVRWNGALEYEDKQLRLHESSLTWKNQSARIAGSLDLTAPDSPAFQLQAGFEDVSAGELQTGMGLGRGIRGKISARLSGHGSLAHPELEAALKGRDLSAFGESFGSLTAGARLSGSRVVIDSLRLEKPQTGSLGIMEASGTMDLDTRELSFRARSNGLGIESMVLPDHIPLRCILSFEAAMTGNSSRPEWSVALDTQALSVADREFGHIRGTISGTGTASTIGFELPEYRADLRGQIGLTLPYPAHLTLDAVALDLSRFHATLPDNIPIDGSVTLNVEATGPLAQPENAVVRVSLQNLDVGVAGYHFGSRSDLHAEWKEQTLILHSAVLESQGGEWMFSGRMPLHASGVEGKLTVDATMPLSILTHVFPAAHDYGIKGVARIQGVLSGSLSDIHPALTLSSDAGELRIPGMATPLTEIALEAGIDKNSISLQRLEARLGEGLIRASGIFPFPLFSGTDLLIPMQAEVDLSGINPSATLDKLQALSGNISLRAVLNADRADLRSLRGSVAIPELRLKAGRTEIEQTEPTRLEIENGRITIERLSLKGSTGTAVQGSGWVSFLDNRAVNLRIAGIMDAEMLSVGRSDFGLDGLIEMKLDVGGSLGDPKIEGTADLHEGRFIMATPSISASALSGHAEFKGNEITLTRLAGDVNGGALSAEGSVRVARGIPEILRLSAVADNFFLDYPKGLRTVSNLKVEARSEGESFLIEGTADVLQGSYREAINLSSLQQESPLFSPEEKTLSDRVKFNIRLRTEGPLAVDNNLARIEAYADLRLVGTARHPSLLGKIELDEGGRVYVSERTFTIVRAVVSFNNEQKIEPLLDLRADTRIGEYTVSFNANGGLKDLQASFTSDPPASQEEIQSLLLTGSPDNTDRISAASLASRSALSLFGSTFVGGFNMRVRRTLGFSEFRIEPSLISADSDPTARLTVGQNLTPELSLTYSTNLRNSNDQIWIAEFNWRQSVVARYLNRSEDTDRGEVRHRLRFGGGPDTGELRVTGRNRDIRIESVQISGNIIFPESVVLKELKLKPGKQFDAIEVQKRVEALARFYSRKGYFEATIRYERLRERQIVKLNLVIDAGPRVAFLFEGAKVQGSLRRNVENAWRSGIVDSERLRATSTLIRQHLFRDRFCDAEISAEVEMSGDLQKTVRYRISPGIHYRRVLIEFPGLKPALAAKLHGVLRQYKLESEMTSDPSGMQKILFAHLREQGYLTPHVALPDLKRDKEQGTYEVEVPVQSGPRYRLGDIGFEGNYHIASAELIRALDVNTGGSYAPIQRVSLVQTIGGVYWRKGYREATVTATEQPVPGTGKVNLLFKIKENRRAFVQDIQAAGNVKTSDDFLRRRIPFVKGDAVDGERLDLLRRRLTNSGSYDTVDITLPAAVEPASKPDSQPLDLLIKVREPKPFSIEYGAIYDTDRKMGFVVDAGLRNVLGGGRMLGYRIAGDQERLDQRIFFAQKFLGSRDIETNVTLAQENSVIDTLGVLRRSLSIQQQIEFRRKFTFLYGYRIMRTETDLDTIARSRSRSSDTTSPLFTALTRDTRDDIFDAARGSYLSQAFEYGPTFLGGSLPYYRYFGQYSRYFGLKKPAAISTAGDERSRFVIATGARIGFMGALENRDFTPGDLFFGGGSTSIRGFKQNSLGPQVDGQPVGGQAVLFLNNEFRAPLYKWLETAVFVDIGNVFEKPSDFRLTDLRKTAGIGLRIRNPFVLIRFDYGWKLDRLSGESRGAFHFGIGQAF